MNDKTKTETTTKIADIAAKGTVVCDLYNPTRARRIIFDGIDGIMKPISVEAGETKRNVTISRHIAEELRDRNRVKKDSDLVPKQPSTEEDKSAA